MRAIEVAAYASSRPSNWTSALSGERAASLWIIVNLDLIDLVVLGIVNLLVVVLILFRQVLGAIFSRPAPSSSVPSHVAISVGAGDGAGDGGGGGAAGAGADPDPAGDTVLLLLPRRRRWRSPQWCQPQGIGRPPPRLPY